MSNITQLIINPATEGATLYRVGTSNNIEIDGVDILESPKVSDIKVTVSPDTSNVIIQIYVEKELYCVYEDVSYVVYYKTSFHK